MLLTILGFFFNIKILVFYIDSFVILASLFFVQH